MHSWAYLQENFPRPGSVRQNHKSRGQRRMRGITHPAPAAEAVQLLVSVGLGYGCSWAQEGQALRARLGGGSVWAATFWTVCNCKQTRTHRFASASFIFNCAYTGSLWWSSPDLWTQRCGANLAICVQLRPHSFPQGLLRQAVCPVVSHCRTR